MRPRIALVSTVLWLFLCPAAHAAVWETAPPAQAPGVEGPPEVPAADLIYDAASNWDWRTPTYAINFVGGTGLVNVDSPFWLPIEGLEDLDYEPEDGWELMARNFGSETVVVNTPFLILYNKYRGVVRFIVYIHSALRENYTWGRVTLRFANGSSRTKNLNHRSIQLPLNRHPYENPVAIINLQDGWNYADFTVGYDPGVASVVQPLFVFEIDGVSVNTVALDGQSVATTTSMGVTNLDQTALGQLKSLIPVFNQGYKNLRTTQKVLDQINAYLAKFEEEDAPLFDEIVQALSIGKPPIALLAGVVGFAEKLIGLKRSGNRPSITTTVSHLKLTGDIRAEEQIANVLLRVPGANHQGQPNARPIWDYPLGVLAILSDPPTTYRTSNSAYRQIAIDNPCVPCSPYYSFFDYMDVLHLDSPVAYAVNTSFPGALQPRSIEAAWSFSTAHPKPAGSPGRWTQTPPYYMDWMNALIAAGRYVLIGSADPNDINFYEYRTQFVDISQFHLFRPEVPRLFLHTEPYFSMNQGVTPPVQIRARFMKPGTSPNDDVILVDSYDLWWPDTSPYEHPPGWNPGALTPVWAEPVAPVQTVLSPAPGQLIAKGHPLEVRWQVAAGSISNVQVALSLDDGQTFPYYLGSQPENSGVFPVGAISTIGTQFRVRVRTLNSPAFADDISDGPFTVWGVDDASVSGGVGSVCVGGASKARLNVSWNTTVPTSGPDQITIWSPPSGTVYTGQVTPAGSTTAHTISKDIPCVTGNIVYRVGSTLNGAFTEGNAKIVTLNQCTTCGGTPCRDCQFEQGALGQVADFFLQVTPHAERGVDFAFGTPAAGPVKLELFDVRGGRVAAIVDAELPAGTHSRQWDGRGRDGSRLGAGIYFARLTAGGRQLTTKVLQLR